MKFCPVIALAHPQNITVAAGVFFAFIFLAGWFVERFWCRYLCPYAALMNIFQYLGNLLGIRRKMIHRNIDKSMNCNNCKNYCPMNIHIDCLETIKDMNCEKIRVVCEICKPESEECVFANYEATIDGKE
ncbi:MAG: 4Fe-4S binding protein, partial [Candidatus Cloacimonadota bacterium]|nr:4Fe-4S binding protein [Candidatus Cloacimonadota bacterium]